MAVHYDKIKTLSNHRLDKIKSWTVTLSEIGLQMGHIKVIFNVRPLLG